VNAVWEAQKGLADALTGVGLPTSPEVPERATPPFRYVLLGGVAFGAQVGSWLVSLNVLCVTRPGTNAVMAEAVTDMVVDVVNAVPDLDGYELASDTVEQPAEFKINGATTLAASVSVTARLSRAHMKG